MIRFLRHAFGSKSHCCASSPPGPRLNGTVQLCASASQRAEIRYCGNWLAACHRRHHHRSTEAIMSAVFFSQDSDGRGTALWHATDDGPGVFCCGVDLSAYNADARVSQLFADLVAAVADHFRRVHAVESVAPASRLAGFDCEKCEAPEAADVRFYAAQSSGALELSPGGHPAGCCKVRIVGAFGSRPDAPRPAAR